MITKKWLKGRYACDAGVKWFEKNVHGRGIAVSALAEKLMLENRFSWVNWLVIENLNKEHNIEYAVFAARQVLDIYEEEYPEDKRPREAIELAEGYLKEYLRCSSKKTAHAAYAFRVVIGAAVDEAHAAAYKAHQDYATVASHAAYAAMYAAYAAIETIDGAVSTADYISFNEAVHAAVDAAGELKLEEFILRYGLSLLDKE